MGLGVDHLLSSKRCGENQQKKHCPIRWRQAPPFKAGCEAPLRVNLSKPRHLGWGVEGLNKSHPSKHWELCKNFLQRGSQISSW